MAQRLPGLFVGVVPVRSKPLGEAGFERGHFQIFEKVLAVCHLKKKCDRIRAVKLGYGERVFC